MIVTKREEALIFMAAGQAAVVLREIPEILVELVGEGRNENQASTMALSTMVLSMLATRLRDEDVENGEALKATMRIIEDLRKGLLVEGAPESFKKFCEQRPEL